MRLTRKRHGKERNLSAFAFIILIHRSAATNSASIIFLPSNSSTHMLGNVLLLRTLQKSLLLTIS